MTNKFNVMDDLFVVAILTFCFVLSLLHKIIKFHWMGCNHLSNFLTKFGKYVSILKKGLSSEFWHRKKFHRLRSDDFDNDFFIINRVFFVLYLLNKIDLQLKKLRGWQRNFFQSPFLMGHTVYMYTLLYS